MTKFDVTLFYVSLHRRTRYLYVFARLRIWVFNICLLFEALAVVEPVVSRYHNIYNPFHTPDLWLVPSLPYWLEEIAQKPIKQIWGLHSKRVLYTNQGMVQP